MIVVISSIYDDSAKQFVKNYVVDENIKLLTAKDLASEGWSCGFAQTDTKQSFCIENQIFYEEEISFILTLLPSITPNELPFIKEEDRAYVAQEMHAFLLGWLFKLKDKVINKPTPSSLIGIFWKQSTWLLKISKFEFDVKKSHFDTIIPYQIIATSYLKIYVVGENIFGIDDKNIQQNILQFTKKYNIKFLTIEYKIQGTKIVLTSMYPNIDINIPFIQESVFKLCKKKEKV
jgi:hypothetical protein